MQGTGGRREGEQGTGGRREGEQGTGGRREGEQGTGGAGGSGVGDKVCMREGTEGTIKKTSKLCYWSSPYTLRSGLE